MLHLEVKKRKAKKNQAKRLLKQGKVAGVVYGPKMQPTPVAVEDKEFNDIYKKAGETTLISLDYKGAQQEEKDKATTSDTPADSQQEKEDVEQETNVVLIRDTQTHPVSGKFLHVDFYQLPLDKPIEITVPVETTGEAPAVKEEGGVLVQNMREVDIKALPTDLIHEISVDISGLKNIDDSITVQDLPVGEKVEILTEPEEVVVSVQEPEEEPEPEEEEAAEEEEIEEIKTEGEEKREEKEAEQAEEDQVKQNE